MDVPPGRACWRSCRATVLPQPGAIAMMTHKLMRGKRYSGEDPPGLPIAHAASGIGTPIARPCGSAPEVHHPFPCRVGRLRGVVDCLRDFAERLASSVRISMTVVRGLWRRGEREFPVRTAWTRLMRGGVCSYACVFGLPAERAVSADVQALYSGPAEADVQRIPVRFYRRLRT